MSKANAFQLHLASCVLPLALLIFALAAPYCASDGVDIDYSHNVAGTGTVMTDFKMWSAENTEVIGRVRGSGEVLNEYVFSRNSSENVSVEDRFLFTKIPESSAIAGYPQMVQLPGAFRLLGTAWAGSINLSEIVSPRAHVKCL